MISAYLNGAELSFAYDSANRLISAGQNSYTYNVEDVRVRNLCGESETTYAYNTNGRLSQLLVKTTDGVITKYVYGIGLIGGETSGSFKTYHFDYRGSTAAITDINGNVTDTFEYDTYGNLVSRTGTSVVIFLYNGRDGVVTDSNGLIYMRARYYSPELRRFINADIIAGEISNAVTLNRYAYANGNPVSNIDPFGLSAERGENSNNWFDRIRELFGWTVDEFKRLTAEGKLDWLLKLTLGATKDGNDIYHIRQDWWQSWHFVGYNDFYDWAFEFGTGMTGTTMAKDKFDFSYNGRNYVIWVWKGDYINLGSGAEAGIYEESIVPGHWLTSTDNKLKMSLSLKEKDSNNQLFNYAPSEYQWWITGFDPSHQNAQANNLQSTVTIDFSDNVGMWYTFKKAWGNVWKFDDMKATLVW